MKKNKYPILIIIIFLSLNFILSGCKDVSQPEEDNTKGVVLNKGSYVNEQSGRYEIYNINGANKFETIDTNEIIVSYNSPSSTYLYVEEGAYYIKYKNRSQKIGKDKIYHEKISPRGDYLFYFTNKQYLTPMIMSLKDNKTYQLKNSAIISGEFIDWIDENKLAYYGVDNENRISGIFTYDLVSSKEELVYKIDKGYIQFLKSMGNGVFFLQETYDDEAVLKCIDSNGQVTEICSEVEEINDIEGTDEGLFILGKIKNNTYSLYEIKNGEAVRLVYDFPSRVNIEKGIISTLNSDIMFVGGKNNSKDDYIYKYSKGSVSIVTKDSGNYNFIDIN